MRSPGRFIPDRLVRDQPSPYLADSDGQIARVDFYAGSDLIGTDSTSPYGITWGDVPVKSTIAWSPAIVSFT